MEQFNPSDKVTLDIPLFIRLLEYAREDAKTDMDLHNVAEKAIAASETGKTLTMADYDGLVAGNSEDQEMNELKRMQQLAGLLNENDNQPTNKYLTVDEEGDYQLNDKAVADYLKSEIDPEEIENVDIFINDDEGYGESSIYFFDDLSDPAETTEKEVEDWAKREMSYWLFSKPDEFPSK